MLCAYPLQDLRRNEMGDEVVERQPEGSKPRFAIYRAKDAREYAEHNVMSIDDITPVVAEGLTHFQDGQVVKLLYAAPGFSLTYVWFKSGYPLPRHSHRSDCLYHIIGGSLRMGQEVLGVGDGFFVGSEAPYTYEPGPEGVEVLEFRNTDQLNIRFRSNNKAAWDKAAEIMAERRAAWSTEQPPRAATDRC
jgi:hypothetical protein